MGYVYHKAKKLYNQQVSPCAAKRHMDHWQSLNLLSAIKVEIKSLCGAEITVEVVNLFIHSFIHSFTH
jgi:hypothetical protein